jgi:mono/diheme cytochrome c family protein
MNFNSVVFFLVVVAAVSISSPTKMPAQDTEVIAGGELEYQNHCAICHGVDGKGRGIMSKFLTIQPADLTQVSKKTAGRFRFGRSTEP